MYKSILISIVVIVGMFFMIVGSNLIEHDGLVLENIQKYNGVKYAFSNSFNYGLYCSLKTGGDYIKISEFAPLSARSVFIDDKYLYFATRERNLVAISLDNYENYIIDTGDLYVDLLGNNDEYLVGHDYRYTNNIVIISKANLEIVDILEKNATFVEITDETFIFFENDEHKEYTYSFVNKVIEPLYK